jgi:cholesterol transport system auxiliary component
MKPSLAPLRPLVFALAAAGLSGCVTVFPKEKAVQLYRFDDLATAPAAAPVPARFTVRATVSAFTAPAAGDRILSASGDNTAYIAQARWVSSARDEFGDALAHAFESHPGPAALLGPGEPVSADKRLFVQVDTFEVRFVDGPHTAPHVVIALRAALESARNPGMRQAREFQAEVPAEANAMSAIVPAFDKAVSDVLGQLVTWVDAAPG